MERVAVKREMLQWAVERSGVRHEELAARFAQLPAWESGDKKPTLRQLEEFAKAVFVPIGFLFLPAPPVEAVPIPDYRTMAGRRVGRPSPHLLDTIYACQERQDWYRDYLRAGGEEPLAFVGSLTIQTSVLDAARALREQLGVSVEQRAGCSTWEEALRLLIGQAESMGVLVMCNGVVGNNTRRKLDPREFRGFALADERAPLVFINGADSKSAQMFTLAHELAHIWLGQSALSDVSPATEAANAVETWCNRVAAELLAPGTDVRAQYASAGGDLWDKVRRLKRYFKVSGLVVLQRLFAEGIISRAQFTAAYDTELQRLSQVTKSSGGDFYLTAMSRYSRKFTRAIVDSTMEGSTLYRDAFRLLGISRSDTLRQLGDAARFGV